MIIDLTDPFTATIIGGLIVAAILGAYHYIKTVVQLNFTEKKISNILSEMDSLHKDYKNQISKIKEVDNKIFKALLETYDQKLIEIYNEHYDPLLQSLKPVIKQNMTKPK